MKHTYLFAQRLGVFLASLILLIHTDPASGVIIPPARTVAWSYSTVGVPGGIPNRTTIYQTLNSGASSSQINTAIANCPSGQVVLLGPGTYSGGINFGLKNNVTLRGSGTNTVLTGTITMGSGGWYSGNSPPFWDSGTTITAGLTQGSSNLTVSSTSTLGVGWLALIDEKNDTTAVFDADGNHPRALAQCVHIQSISGNVVTIWPPLVTTFSTSLDARIKAQGGMQITGDGVENLQMQGDGSAIGFSINNGYGCWAYNVGMHNMANYDLELICCCACTVSHCYLFDSPSHASNHYGVGLQQNCGGCLIENNIIYRIGPSIEINNGSSYNVIAYNFLYDSWINGVQDMDLDMNHTPHNVMNLVEGNYIGVIEDDGYFGSTAMNTLFRNVVTGVGPEYHDSPSCISLKRWSRNYNVVGNILGTNGVASVYELTASGQAGQSIYQLGYPNIGNIGYNGSAPPNAWNNPGSSPGDNQWRDLAVGTTIIRHGNYDTVNKSIVWDSTISDHSIPNSYYLTSKPAWFGSLTWPPYDVTKPTATGLANLPAGYRFIYGVDPSGTGGTPPPQVSGFHFVATTNSP